MENVEKLERAKKVLEFLRTADDKEVEKWAEYFSIDIADPNNLDNGLNDAIIEERNEKGFRVTGVCFGDEIDYEALLSVLLLGMVSLPLLQVQKNSFQIGNI